MIEAVLLGVAFLLSSTVATTLVPSLPLPLAYAPIMMATGLFVMHRAGALLGAVWIVLSAILVGADGGLLASCTAALVGAALAERVFAARSVYALLGLGIITGTVAGVVQIITTSISSLTGTDVQIGDVIGMTLWQILLLLALLYSGFVVLHAIRRGMTSLFVIR